MNKDKPTRKYFSLSVTQNMANEIDKCASNMGINRNAFINMAISTFIENRRVASALDSVKDSMINKFNFEFEKMLNNSQHTVEKAKVK